MILGLAVLVGGCSHAPEPIDGGGVAVDGPPPDPVRAHNVPDAIPRAEPPSRYGNPDTYEVFGKTYHTLDTSVGFVQRGTASWYGRKFHGRRTSSGEPYDMYAMTAAHRELPIPCYVRVTHLENGRSVVVRVNDRGPFHEGRIIDLSYAAASRLGIADAGTGPVEIRAITPGEEMPRVAATTSPLAVPAPAAVPVWAETGVNSGMVPVSLQVGAFNELANATRLRDRLLAKLGRPVVIHEDAASPRYRVRVGPLAAEDDLSAVELALEQMGLGAPQRIVVREL